MFISCFMLYFNEATILKIFLSNLQDFYFILLYEKVTYVFMILRRYIVRSHDFIYNYFNNNISIILLIFLFKRNLYEKKFLFFSIFFLFYDFCVSDIYLLIYVYLMYIWQLCTWARQYVRLSSVFDRHSQWLQVNPCRV